jgi:hypothetical protein
MKKPNFANSNKNSCCGTNPHKPMVVSRTKYALKYTTSSISFYGRQKLPKEEHCKQNWKRWQENDQHIEHFQIPNKHKKEKLDLQLVFTTDF